MSAYLWHEQCHAARGIRERFGSEKALGYLIGEKLLHFLRAADTQPGLTAELSHFAAEIKAVFEPWEIREYLFGVRRLGATGHVLTEEQFEEMRAADALDEDVERAAQDAILIGRMKILLLGAR